MRIVVNIRISGIK